MQPIPSRGLLTAALPTLWFLLAYVGTTVIAALTYVIAPDLGAQMLAVIGVHVPPQVAADIRSPLYMALLLLPLFLVPLSSAGTIGVSVPVLRLIKIPELHINRTILVLIMIAGFGYCLFRLHQLDALNFDALTCGGRADKLQRRLSLLTSLGYPYFALAYGVNMMLPLLAYLAYEKQGRHKVDLAIFVVAMIGMVFFVLTTYSKAPLLVFVVMMASVALAARSSWWHLIVIGLVCGAVFLSIAVLVNASSRCAKPTDAVITNSTSNRPSVSVPANPTPIAPPESAFVYVSKLLGVGIVQRMGAGFPFYVHTYKDESERCGLQGIIRRSIGLDPIKCVPSMDIFKKMWPHSSAAGYQPAPATLAAYSEIGFRWAVAVMVLCGVSLGFAGAIAYSGSGSLYLALCAAASGFGYYLTQVPFFASITYPHGLLAFLAPIILLAAASLLFGRRSAITH